MEDLQSILLPGIDSKRPIIIAGPCSAETEEQVMTTAKSLAERGIKIFRRLTIRHLLHYREFFPIRTILLVTDHNCNRELS